MVRFIACLVLMTSASAQAVGWGEFLRGHWQTECRRTSLGSFTQSGYTFSDFSGPEFQLVMHGVGEYLDSKCTKTLKYNQVSGHLKLESASVGDPMKGARIRWQIDPLIQYPYAAYERKRVADLNAKLFCGQNDWILGKAKNLLDTACAKEIVAYYATSTFILEVTDAERLRLTDKAGVKEEIKRWSFVQAKPTPAPIPAR